MNIVKKATVFVALLSSVLAMSLCLVSAESDDNAIIREGVRIDNLDVSNMTEKEATSEVKAYVKNEGSIKVSVDVNGTNVETTLSKLGYKWQNKSVIEDALGVGKSGNAIKRYKDSIDLDNEGIELKLELGISKDDLKKNLQEACDEYNVEAKNASLEMTSSGFQIIPEQDGVVVDYDKTVAGLYDYITNEWDGSSSISYAAETEVSKPKYTTKDLELVSSEPMGTYYTNFSVGSSYDNRNNNIKNGADKLDGILLYPGEQYSLNEHLAPWTAENGWYPAGTYVDGGVSDSYGGGICQVSSTLYNALLDAEIKVVERFSHSMSVAYVPLSADAALAGDYKDLVFENNTDAPIYIESVFNSGGTLTFRVYGHDTRDPGRTVEYVSKTTKEIPVTTKVVKDSSKPTDYEYVESNGHVGYVAELWKVVYENGEEVERELLHTSKYAMTQKVVVKGTKKEKETKEDEESTKANKKPDSSSDETEKTTKAEAETTVSAEE